MQNNPYNFNLPAKQNMFFGRSLLLERIAKRLLAEDGDSFALIGGRRIGKTSLLDALHRRLNSRQDIGSCVSQSCPVLFHLGPFGVGSVQTFFQTIIQESHKVMSGRLAVCPTPVSISDTCNPALALAEMLELWQAAWCSDHGGQFQLVLLMDECEKVARYARSDEIYDKLRWLLVDNASTRPLFKIVMVGSGRFLNQVVNENSPLRNIFYSTRERLGVLEPGGVEKLINKPIDRPGFFLPPDVVRAVIIQSGGHPCLTQYLMHHLWEQDIEKVTAGTVDLIAAGFGRDLSHFEDWLTDIGSDGKRAYQLLARATSPLSTDELWEKTRWRARTKVEDALEALDYHGLIAQAEDHKEITWQIAGRMFHDWFRKSVDNWPTSAQSRKRSQDPLKRILSTIELRVKAYGGNDTVLDFELNSLDGHYHHVDCGLQPLFRPPKEYLQHTFDELSTLAAKPSEKRTPSEYNAALTKLDNTGASLFESLFPPQLREKYPGILQSYAGGSLLVTADVPSLPWELIKPRRLGEDGEWLYRDPMLCEGFRMARWKAGKPRLDSVDLRQAALVCPPSNLAGAKHEAAYFAGLSAQLPGLQLTPLLGSLEEVITHLSSGEVGLFHFACHGLSGRDADGRPKLKLSDGLLSLEDIEGDVRAGLMKARPIIFLNACQTGDSDRGLTRLDGWADRFIDFGASVFIGTSWNINDVLAAQFTEEFYNRLFGLSGFDAMTLGEAFRQARLAIKELDPANPTWLAYVLYGDPNAQVSIGIQE